MVKKVIPVIFSVSIISFLLTSCGNNSNEQQQAPAEDTMAATTSAVPNDSGAVDDLTQFKYDKLISNIPIPFDILRLHEDIPLSYNASVVNPTSNLSAYSSSTAKALNLGVYGGDLAYSITYEKFEDVGNYLKCAKKLAEDLGIPLAFDQQALTTYKKYGTNKDSLEKIVFNSYSEVDKTLKSNERLGLASLVVTGGWLEGLYATLTTMGSTPKDEKSQGLYKKIWEQKNHLNMIISLLEQFKDDKAFASIIQDLNAIKSVYDGMADKSSISQAEVATLAQKVAEVRGKIIAH